MPFNPKWVIGRTIVSVEMNPFRKYPEDPLDHSVAYDPKFVLDNGARLAFVTQETETGDYGTDILYTKPPRKRRA